MPIQFLCPSCQQPLEVDDQYALQTAQCCYCGQPAPVPAASTLAPPGGVIARPLETTRTPRLPARLDPNPPTSFSPPPSPASVSAARLRSSMIYGNFALICTTLVLILLVVSELVMNQSSLPAQIQQGQIMSRPSVEEAQKLMENPQVRYLIGATCGALFFALAGLSFGITSIVQMRKSWRGWVAIAICGGLVFCSCSSSLRAFLQ